ncbi:MAG: aspartate carbamoyltransferase catalytic subunit [Sphingobacteriia bacterium]|jgi:aspartate carbamoyltransferase catalytic subunit
MSELSVKHLLGIKGLQAADLEILFSTTREFKTVLERPIKKVPSLRDVTIANLFFENSTRTRISFELAQKRLSADVINFSASSSSVSKGESLLDTVNNILAMKVDVIVMRHPRPGAPHFLARHISAAIVNAGDGTHEHPTQALLDAYSLQERLGPLAGAHIAIVGDIVHSRVALSNIFCLQLLGAKVRVCGPPTLIPRYIQELGVEVSHNLDETIRWADALNMLRIQLERQDTRYFPSLQEYHQLYGLSLPRLERANKALTVLHPGPINRGVEITSEVADHPQAVILDQVLNGVASRMAVLYLLAGQTQVG